MRLNKYASWGDLPSHSESGPAAEGTLRARVTRVAAAISDDATAVQIAVLAKAIEPLANIPARLSRLGEIDQQGLREIAASIDRVSTQPAPTPIPTDPQRLPTPSRSAFGIVSCLRQVRDALCDQGSPTIESTNKQLGVARKSVSAEAAKALLAKSGLDLLEGFESQFRGLAKHNAEPFDQQRRSRLAELADYEAKVMRNVRDDIDPGAAI